MLQDGDAELGSTGAAGLASVETLDDSAQEKTNAAAAGNNAQVDGDGMETVRLDAEAADGPPIKPHPLVLCMATLRRNLIASSEYIFLCILFSLRWR